MLMFSFVFLLLISCDCHDCSTVNFMCLWISPSSGVLGVSCRFIIAVVVLSRRRAAAVAASAGIGTVWWTPFRLRSVRRTEKRPSGTPSFPPPSRRDSRTSRHTASVWSGRKSQTAASACRTSYWSSGRWGWESHDSRPMRGKSVWLRPWPRPLGRPSSGCSRWSPSPADRAGRPTCSVGRAPSALGRPGCPPDRTRSACEASSWRYAALRSSDGPLDTKTQVQNMQITDSQTIRTQTGLSGQFWGVTDPGSNI